MTFMQELNTQKRTAQEVVKRLQPQNVGKRFAINKRADAIACWIPLGMFQVLLTFCIDGKWRSAPIGTSCLTANGVALFPPADWVEVVE